MTPRLQAKIPKMFAWQLYPGYDYYVWLDGNLFLSHHNSLEYLLGAVEDHDIVVLKHPRRDTVYWEYRYNWRGLNNNAPSNYLRKRYTNELLVEQHEALGGRHNKPSPTEDIPLYNGGVFIYRNIAKVHELFKEWWYHVSRYLIMDQLSFAYLLKTYDIRVNVLHEDFSNTWWLENGRHAK